jgi:DNA polymerase I
MGKLLIIDGNSIMNRAFYGLSGRNMLKTGSGIYTNAIYGFLNILNRYLSEDGFSHFAVAFDRREPTFRHELYEDYKAGREKMPDELAMQMPIVKDIIDALGIVRVETPGIEADDIIGTYARTASENDFDVTILTGDKDLFQLIDDKIKVDYTSTRAGSTSTTIYDEDALMERYGITPSQMIDLKALMGDSSDNIPGVKGIGEKGATKLIKEFGSVDSIYNNIQNAGTQRTIDLLEKGRELCYLSRELGKIKTDAKVDKPLKELKKSDTDEKKLKELFEMLEFRSLMEKFGLKKERIQKKQFREVKIIKDLKGLSEKLENFHGSISLYFDAAKTDGIYELSTISVVFDDAQICFLQNEELLKELLLADSLKRVIVFDSKPLFSFYIRKYITLKADVFDVSLASYLLDPDGKNDDISELYHRYFNRTIKCPQEQQKEQISLFEEADDKNIQARCIFAEAVEELGELFEKKLEENELEKLYYEIELPVAGILAEMELNGIASDIDVLRSLDQSLIKQLGELEEKIMSLAGTRFNLNSPKQLGEVLFEKLKLPVIKKTRTGYSTNAEVLETLRGRHEVIEHILNYRQLEKLRSTYSSGLISQVSSDGRIYSTFNQKVTSTGRLSSQDPNLQNIPVRLEQGREFRKAFIAGKGNVLIDADYSQIELRVLAHFSGDPLMKEVYKNDEDIHSQTALYIFDEENIDNITPTMRNSAKTINFSVIYGISAYSLSVDLGITRKEAQKYIDEYFEKYTGVKAYLDKAIAQAKENGYVKTLFGRRRYLNEINSGNFNIRSFWERVAMNTPIQGTAADIIKLAMINVDQALKKGGYRAKIVLQVHDELLVECPLEEKDEVQALIADKMQNACALDVPLKVDIKSGGSWYETK